MNVTELARGRACEIRAPGECLPGTETVCLCHVRMPDLSGLGFKAPDWLGAFGCQRCHDIVDGRTGDWVTWPGWRRDLMLLEGTARTLVILINEGVIYVPEPEKRRPPPLPKIYRRPLA
jgi:hypothetical protein